MCLPILVHKLAVELKGKLQDGIPDPPLTCIFVSTCRCAKPICLLPPTSNLYFTVKARSQNFLLDILPFRTAGLRTLIEVYLRSSG